MGGLLPGKTAGLAETGSYQACPPGGISQQSVHGGRPGIRFMGGEEDSRWPSYFWQ
jgi:hypothetical protein